MKKYTESELVSQMLRKSREDAELSQDSVAKRMGISKRTVQNWENGTSSPTADMIVAWFKAIHKQIVPYLLQTIYDSDQTESLSSDQLDDMLLRFVQGLPRRQKEELVYLAYGDHGTAPLAFVELQTAYLQTSLRDRVIAAQLIKSNYELSRSFNSVTSTEHVQPDLDVINEFIDVAKSTIKDKLGRR